MYFENLLEELAFRYSPGQNGNPGKYYAKYYRQNEFEMEPNASAVFLAVNEGLLIRRQKYERYHVIKGRQWNREAGQYEMPAGFGI